jgi:undecaprenyl-diphosphatase
MPVVLIVLGCAALAALIVWALSRHPAGPDPVDPEPEERWLMRWLGAHPRYGATARRLDRRVAGGLMLVVALGVTFVTALVVGAVFDMVDEHRGLARWDRSVAAWGSEHATTRSTDVLGFVTNFGATRYLCIAAVIIAAIDYRRSRNWNVPLFLLAVLGGIVLVNNGLKWIVGRPRPDVVHLVGTAGSSFPSGHSAAAAAGWCAFALVLSRHWTRRGRSIAAACAGVIAVAVASSRALLGVHWLTDVIAGLAVGWGWFLLVALAFGGRLQRLGEPAARAVAVVADPAASASASHSASADANH